MECSQSLKVLFPKRVFMNTETVVEIPKSGDMVKKIRVVLNVTQPNTLGENIINECELIQNGKVIEKTYGDFLHVDNLVKTPIEKRDKLNQLLCKTSPGIVYLDLKFKEFFMISDTQLRILFGPGNSEVNGYLLVDYALISKPPTFPFFQRVRQIQKVTVVTESSNQLVADVYLVGSVYELYFTVKNSSGNLVDAIKNIRLINGNEERINLSGDYLRLVEPMKRHGRVPTEPVYVYSFGIEPESDQPSGQTHLADKQRFIIDLYDNDETYVVTVYAQNHTFYYATQSNVLPVFESSELLISSTTNPSTLTELPIKTSYTNYANTITVSYTSDYEIENVTVTSNIQNYTISQNEINFTGIDSVFGQYYANVTYSSRGFSNLTCEYNFKGSNIMKNTDVLWIDGGQDYYSSSIINSVFGLGLSTITIDYLDTMKCFTNEYKNIFVPFITSIGNKNINILDTSIYFPPYLDLNDKYLVKFDSNYNIIYYLVYSCLNYKQMHSRYNIDTIAFFTSTSNSRINYSSSSLKLPDITSSEKRAVILNIKNNTFNFFNFIYCGGGTISINTIKLDSKYNTYVSGVTYGSPGYITITNSDGSQITTQTATGNLSFFIKFDSNGFVVDYYFVDNTNIIVEYPVQESSVYTNQITFDLDRDENMMLGFYVRNNSKLYSKNGIVKTYSFTGYDILKLDNNLNIIWNLSNNNYVNDGSGMIIQSNRELDSFFIKVGKKLFKITKINTINWNVDIENSGTVSGVSFIDQCTGNITFLYKCTGSINFTGSVNYSSSGNGCIVFDNTDTLFNYEKKEYRDPFLNGTFFDFQNDTLLNRQWITNLSSTYVNGLVYNTSITSDSNGNVYVTGYYGSNPLTIYNADGSVFGTLSLSGSYDSFIVKYNTNGTAQWATRLSGTNFDYGTSITSDSNGNVYVTGYYGSNPLTIYNADGSVFGTLSNSGADDSFIVKYNTNGTAQWATRLSGTGIEIGTSITSDSNGNVYVTGSYGSNPLTIYNADGSVFGTLSNSGSYDSFIVKYNTNGTAQWATRLSGTGIDYGNSITSDSNGNVYVTGYYGSNPLTIYNADGSVFGTLSNSGIADDSFIVKYNTNGTAQWATRLSGTGSESGYSITSDSNGNVYVTGYYGSNPLTIYNADGSVFGTLSNSGVYVSFIVKYNTNGTAQWATRLSGTGIDYGNSITSDSNGNVYVTGYYSSNPLTIYNADGSVFGTLSNSGSYDSFIVKYNTNGTAQWATRLSGTGSESAYSITSDSNGNVYVTGSYGSNPLTMYNYNGTEYKKLSKFIFSLYDGFILKYTNI